VFIQKVYTNKKARLNRGGLTNFGSKSWSDARPPSDVVMMDVAGHEV
jgi:hypothetical protein